MTIAFGTDGWRGVIGDDFSFANVQTVARAMARFYRDKKWKGEGDRSAVVIGYDTRFLGETAALIVAECFAAAGVEPIVSKVHIPTPCLSFQVKHRGLLGGVMVTASHNPSLYNGLKFKAHYGGTASTEMYARMADFLEPEAPGEAIRPRREIRRENFIPDYLSYVRELVDLDLIGGQGWQILWDAMHGASGSLFMRLFESTSLYVKTLRSYPDPTFGGCQPEPIFKNLQLTVDELAVSPCDLAFASDGDGDRLGVLLPGPQFVTPHEVFALIALHMIKVRGQQGGIARTFSSSLYLDRIAEDMGVPLYETGIGFKYLCPHLTSGDVVVAGEESGGLAVAGGLPERDALVTASLLLETLSMRRYSLPQALCDLRRTYGDLHYARDDMELDDPEDADAFIDRLKTAPPDHIAGRRVTKVHEKDGLKFTFGDDGWLLFRRSGTEPLIRLYCELPSREAVTMTLREARSWISVD
ncbi:MAG TPA: phosphoglucomutase/phosphomannomutase family protein [Thermoanaerobaculia bacterium]|nr:phosphoglucomutase/phosphomannomutase family protein [Thermoanaerobaculia bacterium]HUM31052.1 phosphoglucomutase/phosphomannomutase family protein [Thermoanaerobaculia bacterium]HXK69350.1 phosphoglucomutase/phosphomannomutase family protein [Thermoanaerobaculia bacterium]